MTRNVTEVLQDIKDTKVIANTSIEDVPFKMRPGFSVGIIQAKEKLPQLMKELKSLVVPSRLVGLFAKGDTNAVAEFFDDNGSIVVDANSFYKAIADDIETTYGMDRQFADTQYGRLVANLREVCTVLGYSEIPSPTYTDCKCATPTDTLNTVKRLVRGSVKDYPNLTAITDKILAQIVDRNMESRQIAVLVVGSIEHDEKAVLSALFSRTVDYTFPKGYQPNKNSIMKILKQQDEKETE